MAVSVPEWVKHAVFYQIFPDRFARSARNPLPAGITLKPWGTPPEEQGFQGGDLYGIVEKLDYLRALGITALYLNPVFASASNHRYHTYDYFTVDPLLGGNDALRALLDAAHARGMRVVLDGVFNHASRGFWPFHHVLETGGNSPYVDWFYIHDWPLTPYPPDDKTPINYGAWWGMPALPKLNVANPGMRAYLLEVAEFWVQFGIDGWRLDVAEEITDATFWQEFRHVVKRANPDAYIVGEIWHEAHDWLRGDRFDAVMNYVLSRAALGFFGARTLRTDYKPGGFALYTLRAQEFARTIETMLQSLDWEIVQAQLNLMDSHDTARTLWTVREDRSALKLCTLLQMTMPGAPCIYYGDEIGLSGATDPYCRAAFPWDQPERWDQEILGWHRRAIAMRHAHPVLRTGTVQTLYADHGLFAMLRRSADAAAVVVFNTRLSPAQITLDSLDPAWDGRIYQDVWLGGQAVQRSRALHDLTVPAREALVLVHRE